MEIESDLDFARFQYKHQKNYKRSLSKYNQESTKNPLDEFKFFAVRPQQELSEKIIKKPT